MDGTAGFYPPNPQHYSYHPHPAATPLVPAAAPHPPPTEHQSAYLPHYQPSYVSYAPPLHFENTYDEVRTLFVAGLPSDVNAREIYNLFREFPGYESSHLRSPTEKSQPFAFAVFSDQQSAIVAMQALNGMIFDLEKGSALYIDLAKANSRSKRSRADDDRSRFDKRVRASSAFPKGISDSGVGSIHMPGLGNSAYNMIGYPPTQRSASEATAPKLISSAAHSPRNNHPCPTLFVANLGPACTEQELTQVFSRCRGFLKLKMQSTYGAPVAFVDFQDTAGSTDALNQLQGTILYSSPDGVGMRLEYAKSRMGMRKRSKY